jgi:hypothetical protein
VPPIDDGAAIDRDSTSPALMIRLDPGIPWTISSLIETQIVGGKTAIVEKFEVATASLDMC